MKNGTKKNKKTALLYRNRLADICADKNRRIHRLEPVCWVVVPVIMVILLILDALGIYILNLDRLRVLGIGLMVVLLPFFSEVTVKGLSIRIGEKKHDFSSKHRS